MSKVVIITCDRCGKVKEEAEMFCVSIRCEHLNFINRNQYYTPTTYQQSEWCKECVVEMKVMRPQIIRPASPVAKQTIEDIIREIVKEEQSGGG